MVHKLKLGEYFKMSKLGITFQNLLEHFVGISSPADWFWFDIM